jgi:beta-galactosidase/beta-glucuronidase
MEKPVAEKEEAVAPPPHPRPQHQRARWLSLNGEWDFALDPEARWTTPDQVVWHARINVPFAPETPASGIGDRGFYRACWYRRHFVIDPPEDGQRLLLHFDAVDHAAAVWLNGCLVARHAGGYTPFHADVTDVLAAAEEQTVVVRAEDDPQDLAKPRGKQDWQRQPHSIWYPRTTGIWQTVWLEWVPATWVSQLRWIPSLERWEIGLEAWLAGERRAGLRLAVRLTAAGAVLAQDTYQVVAGEVHRRIALSDPGIDDYRNELLWSPASPTLIEAELELRTENGRLLDRVQSYTALRAIGVQGDRLVLNGRPYLLRLVLDQGYWPESGLTPPDDEALRRDVELARSMGFNGVRKHQKIEVPRYLYWADRLGLLVWEEMPSAYRYTRSSIELVTQQWMEVMARDVSHPSIVAWVPFNESWGVPNLPDSPAQRHYVQALYHLTKTLDPSRPVVGNDGWESVATDIIGIHDYDDRPDQLLRRYGSDDEIPRLFQRERPGGRLLVLGNDGRSHQPIMLSEFGGIALAEDEQHTWGYSRAETPEALAYKYTQLLAAVHSLRMLAGFCYTQFADTYQEANGLLREDRTPKFPLEEIAAATRGPEGPRDTLTDFEWRRRMMETQRHQYQVPAEDYRIDNR